LDHPFVVGEGRKALLDGLNKLSKEDFEGDLCASWIGQPIRKKGANTHQAEVAPRLTMTQRRQ
jgi:hypothetical protein